MARKLSGFPDGGHNRSRHLQGEIAAKTIDPLDITKPSDAAFGVYSQWGEDGVIEWILQRCDEYDVDVPPAFIEFGVGDYSEANTRFLLENRNWRGLIMDASEHVLNVTEQDLYWRHELHAAQEFITRETVNELFEHHGFVGDIGLLSIDIDGMDYWIWEAIDTVNPAIVIVEYQSLFGAENSVTVPYEDKFSRFDAHYSGLYYGASLPALVGLGIEKGYSFIGCTKNGVNAFFIRDNLEIGLPHRSAKVGFQPARVRDSRGPDGRLTHLNYNEQIEHIEGLPLVDLSTGGTTTVGELLSDNRHQ